MGTLDKNGKPHALNDGLDTNGMPHALKDGLDKDGRPGCVAYKNGDIFEGSFKEGIPNKGVIYGADGIMRIFYCDVNSPFYGFFGEGRDGIVGRWYGGKHGIGLLPYPGSGQWPDTESPSHSKRFMEFRDDAIKAAIKIIFEERRRKMQHWKRGYAEEAANGRERPRSETKYVIPSVTLSFPNLLDSEYSRIAQRRAGISGHPRATDRRCPCSL